MTYGTVLRIDVGWALVASATHRYPTHSLWMTFHSGILWPSQYILLTPINTDTTNSK